MDIAQHAYIDKMKQIQSKLIKYIESDDNPELDYENLNTLFDNLKIRQNKSDLKLTLHLIASISKNHYRGPDFFHRISRILENFKQEMRTFFSNLSIFNIFKGNKVILLFLFEEGIVVIDKNIVTIFKTKKYFNLDYPYYFYDEIKPFVDVEYHESLKNDIPDDYKMIRRGGVSHYNLCAFIRNDLLDEFINYCNEQDLILDNTINQSITETNSLLHKKKPTLVEYAAFYGSLNIIKYLQENDIELTPSLWIYAIHSFNNELIYYLEDNGISPPKNSYQKCILESIKCHHNQYAQYFKDNYCKNLNFNSKLYINYCLKYYNFNFIENILLNESHFYTICKYDYFYFASLILMENKEININEKKI